MEITLQKIQVREKIVFTKEIKKEKAPPKEILKKTIKMKIGKVDTKGMAKIRFSVNMID
jgi:hypothetical protein